MASGRYGLALRRVGRLLGRGSVAALGPGQLLERFAVDRDEAAFEALVTRHGPMVLGTCRRMLSDPHDVDDAFQATFLVLARKAGSIRDADRLGPWLHGVARRVATRSRALSARRRSRERLGAEEQTIEPPDALEASEDRAALDEELARLPEKYRAPLVLCYLEGLTHDEAAEHLRWPVGTVRSRLAGGRSRLRDRLTRRGLAPTAAVPVILTQASIPQALLSTTVRLATSAGSAPAHVAALAKGALIAMMWNKLKVVAALGLMAGLTVGGAGVAAQYGGMGKANAPVAEVSKNDQIEERIEEIYLLYAIQQAEAERSRLKTDLTAIRRKMEQMKFEHVTALRELEKQAEEIQTRLTTAEQKWKDLTKKGEPAPRDGEALKDLESAYKVIKRLEAELQAARSETQRVNAKLDVLVATKLDDSTKKSNPSPEGGVMGTGGGPGPGASAKPPADQAKATANLPRRDASPMVMQLGGANVLVIPAEKDWATILNTETGNRSTQRFPQGMTEVMPVISMNGLGALVLKGPGLRQVAAFDMQGAKWYTQDLHEPTAEASPIVGRLQVTYQLGRFLYVFSAQAKKWSVLEFKRDPGKGGNFLPSMHGMGGLQGDKLIIPEDDLVHIYDPKTGEWTHMNTGDDK